MRFLARTIILCAVMWAVSRFSNLIVVDGWLTALISGVALSLVNSLVKPVLHILALPVHLATLGLSNFLLNGIVLMCLAHCINGLSIHGFWTACLAAFVISFISWGLNHLLAIK